MFEDFDYVAFMVTYTNTKVKQIRIRYSRAILNNSFLNIRSNPKRKQVLVVTFRRLKVELTDLFKTSYMICRLLKLI